MPCCVLCCAMLCYAVLCCAVLRWCRECTGVIPHGQMTLLLAPPGAGKSQFLKTLAGRMRKEKRVTGELYFNGLTADEQLAAGQYIEKMCGFIQQGRTHRITTQHNTTQHRVRQGAWRVGCR